MLSTIEHRHEQGGACRSHCIDCPAVRGNILSELIQDGVDSCRFETHAVEVRGTLPRESIPPGSLVMLRRGVVIRQRLSEPEAPVAVDVVGSGGAFFVGEGDQTAYAVDRTLYCVCAKEIFLEALATSVTGIQDLHQLHTQTITRMERLAEARGRQQVRARVAALLCAMADTLSPNGPPRTHLPPGLLQRDLAALVSTRHESVCRIMRELAEAKIVEHGPDGIEILDRARLAAI